MFELDNACQCVARGMQEHAQELSWHPLSAGMLLPNHGLATHADGVVRRTGVTPVLISVYLYRYETLPGRPSGARGMEDDTTLGGDLLSTPAF